MFAQQVDVLQQRFRCITFDWRGQGQSEVTRAGYDMESLYADTLALIDALGIKACHFIGLSMGGFIGMRLAARRPDIVRSLILLGTSADPEPAANIPKYRMLDLVGRWLGFRLVAAQVMPIMFGQKFLRDPTRAQLREEWRRRMLANHRIGITQATAGVISRRGIADHLHAISGANTHSGWRSGCSDAAGRSAAHSCANSSITAGDHSWCRAYLDGGGARGGECGYSGISVDVDIQTMPPQSRPPTTRSGRWR